MKEIHESKSHDYAKDNDPFSNFKRSAEIAAVSPNIVFQVMIGIKIARLEELLRGKEPKNESIEDSFIDLANYCVLWGAFYKGKEEISWGTVPDEMRKTFQEKLRNDIRNKGTDERTCIKCGIPIDNQKQYIKHAIKMHSAVYNKAQHILTFNDSVQVLRLIGV